MLTYHDLCVDDMIDVYSDSLHDVEYSNIDSLVEKIVLHSDFHADVALYHTSTYILTYG